MKHSHGRAWIGIAVFACTDASLESTPEPLAAPPDVLVRVSGNLCTRDAEEIRFPVRIAFIVDTSGSMLVSDPLVDPVTGASGTLCTGNPACETGRQRAIRDVVEALGISDEIAYGIIAFNGTTQVTTQIDADGDGVNDTDGFTSESDEIVGAIADLSNADSTTNYIAALDTAYQLAFADVLRQEPDEVARSRYVFVFISDGLPDTDDDEPVKNEDILNAVGDIADLQAELRVGEVNFHTAYLSSNSTPLVEQAATDLLQDMAEVGEGTFRSFPNGDAIDFLSIDFTSIRRVFALSDLIATNINARPLLGARDDDDDGVPDTERAFLPEADTDADGLIDVLEIDSDINVPDTDGDGFSDFLEWKLAQSAKSQGQPATFDPSDPSDGQCPSEVDRQDLDGDGLRDCEELFFGSNPRFFDTDLDGLPDPIEVVFGTDAAFADAADDTDVDGGRNGDEVRAHTDPLQYDAADRAERSYLYDVIQLPLSGPTTCADFEVSSIPLAPTAEGWSEIRVYASERPFDRFDAFSLWRVACIRARYLVDEQLKIPASGQLELADDAFVPVEEFDATLHCVDGTL